MCFPVNVTKLLMQPINKTPPGDCFLLLMLDCNSTKNRLSRKLSEISKKFIGRGMGHFEKSAVLERDRTVCLCLTDYISLIYGSSRKFENLWFVLSLSRKF